LASTWDPDLLLEIKVVIDREKIRARGVRLALSPVVDVARDPRWGPIEETFSEYPYLADETGVAAIKGLQGANKADTLARSKVFATLKHLTGHGHLIRLLCTQSASREFDRELKLFGPNIVGSRNSTIPIQSWAPQARQTFIQSIADCSCKALLHFLRVTK
jgi:hypothetical protein